MEKEMKQEWEDLIQERLDAGHIVTFSGTGYEEMMEVFRGRGYKVIEDFCFNATAYPKT